ncbi:hypothetical protein FHS04_002284 [Mesoflavibacter sabulilitoris]|uniref:TIR domain-containing protein n=1 Tax=Mesoflavibacter zeaxanthinifaciens subsp. sabulilitoris TaxID=1520893 RepID=A0A2T1NFD3_9FLAO|nr:hypothetical protein [Mesoflavibacter zeaxanthinifaciens]MBB3124757.1 hypothetical protein [Mesoflavibacter zeaxanthinifaciens subsp. sabulilitoris]PSG91148.1 hypothetical protein C7H61_07815 [Mesoflavibacter zeaxanthinifaciens subsp. sabulilitoris]
MASIFLIGQEIDPDKNISLFYEISYRLQANKHKVITLDRDFGKERSSDFQNLLKSADVIIPVITQSSLKSKEFYDQLTQIRNYVSHKEDKILIPVVNNDVVLSNLPESIIAIKFIRVDDKFDENELDLISKKINEAINSFLGRKIAKDEKAKEIKEKIEKTAPTYISETILELENRERYKRWTALFWYFLGFISLIIGIWVAVYFSDSTIIGFQEKENWSLTFFYTLKSIFIILLLIASSKYSFTLAKSYMSESLKIADRIHAISFGKFYLQVFDEQINPNEIKEIFRDWNINNQNSEFSNQSTSDYDPKLLEKIIELIEKVRK